MPANRSSILIWCLLTAATTHHSPQPTDSCFPISPAGPRSALNPDPNWQAENHCCWPPSATKLDRLSTYVISLLTLELLATSDYESTNASHAYMFSDYENVKSNEDGRSDGVDGSKMLVGKYAMARLWSVLEDMAMGKRFEEWYTDVRSVTQDG